MLHIGIIHFCLSYYDMVGVIYWTAILVLCLPQLSAHHILLFPFAYGFGSHMMDMIYFTEILQQRGHEISILINRRDIDLVHQLNVTTYTYPAPGRTVAYNSPGLVAERFLGRSSGGGLVQMIRDIVDEQASYCEELLKSGVLDTIKSRRFNLLLVDFSDLCSRVITYYLDIPTVMFNGVSLGCDGSLFPNLPSIVPSPMTGMPNTMGFWERLKNTAMLWTRRVYITPYIFGTFDKLKNNYKMNTSLFVEDAFLDKIIVAYCDSALEYPRPLSPNIACVGGIHIKPPDVLRGHLAELLKDGGGAGFVVVSFGSLVAALDRRQTDIIARALGRLAQKVIWRHTGVPPTTLGNNTVLLEWLPQATLLAQPSARAFLTHSGLHSTYEAIHFGVPVVAMPLFMDQFEHAHRLVERLAMGCLVDYDTLNENHLYNALTDVIYNEEYLQNAKRASRIFRDQPIPLKDKFVYNIEYQIRHAGSDHLMMESLKQLNVLELYAVDVTLCLLAISVSVIVVAALILKTMLLIAIDIISCIVRTRVFSCPMQVNTTILCQCRSVLLWLAVASRKTRPRSVPSPSVKDR